MLTVCPAGPPQCQFRAIQPALDAAGDGDEILVARGRYSGPIHIAKSVSLVGAGAGETTIGSAAREIGPVVSVSSRAAVSMSGLLVTGRSWSRSIRTAGIYNEGALTLEDSIVSGNSADGAGGTGGIYSSGSLLLRRSTVSDNEGAGVGGIFNARGPLIIRNSAVSRNIGDAGAG